MIFRGALFRSVGQQQQAGFVVLSLPGMQKAVGGGEGCNVFRVQRRVAGLGLAANSGDSNRTNPKSMGRPYAGAALEFFTGFMVGEKHPKNNRARTVLDVG